MALQTGDVDATTGMSKAIYEQLDALLSPGLPGTMPAADLAKVRQGWKQLAFAIASGVVGHVTTNMEIYGIVASDSVSNPTVTCTQTNDGTGHVR